MASNVKTVDELAIASVKTFCGLAIASAGTINGIDNTSGFTYLVNEDFETTGTPTHWFANNADCDYATNPLAGSQSLSITTAGTPSNVGYANGTNGATLDEVELYGKFLFRPDSFTDSYSKIMQLMNNGGAAAMLVLYIRASGALTVQDSDGTILADTADVMTAGSNYRVYFHYLKGSGTNAVCSCGFATTDSRPTSGTKFAGGTNGHSTSNVEWLQYAPTGVSGTQFIIDNAQLATTAFN